MDTEKAKENILNCYEYVTDAFIENNEEKIEYMKNLLCTCLKEAEQVDEDMITDITTLVIEYRLFYSKSKLKDIYISLLQKENIKIKDQEIQDLLEALLKECFREHMNYEDKIFIEKIFSYCNDL